MSDDSYPKFIRIHYKRSNENMTENCRHTIFTHYLQISMYVYVGHQC